MDATPKQEITIHQSLHQPILVMGGERNLVLMLGVIAGVFIFSLAQLWAAIVGILLWVFGQWGLAQLAKYDPLLSKTGARHIKYQKYYPAASTPFAPDRTIN
jgi:type IV secretory pathway TrbD component